MFTDAHLNVVVPNTLAWVARLGEFAYCLDHRAFFHVALPGADDVRRATVAAQRGRVGVDKLERGSQPGVALALVG